MSRKIREVYSGRLASSASRIQADRGMPARFAARRQRRIWAGGAVIDIVPTRAPGSSRGRPAPGHYCDGPESLGVSLTSADSGESCLT